MLTVIYEGAQSDFGVAGQAPSRGQGQVHAASTGGAPQQRLRNLFPMFVPPGNLLLSGPQPPSHKLLGGHTKLNGEVLFREPQFNQSWG